MTPAQQTALESLVDRPLTPAEITSIDPHLDANTRNDRAIAEILSIGRSSIRSNVIGELRFLTAYSAGLAAADTVLGKLETHAAAILPLSRIVKRLLRLLTGNTGLDMGNPAVRAVFDSLTADGIITVEEGTTIKLMGEFSAPIHYNEVSRVLNTAEGRLS